MDELRIWSVVRSPAEILQNYPRQLLGATNSLANSSEPGLAAYYRFNEGIGVKVNDATRQHNAADLRSGVSWLPLAPYNAGSALALAGGYVEIPDSPAFNVFPFTFTAWVQTSAAQDFPIIASRSNALSIGLSNGRPTASFYRTGGNAVFDTSVDEPIADGLWHHLAFTVDNYGGRLYVDGIFKGDREWTGSPGAPTAVAPLFFGASGALGLNGQIDEVALWNVALDPVAIQTNMSRRLTGADPGLVALYHFDEASGNLVLDSSSGARDGTLINTVPRVSSGARISGLAEIRGRLTSGGTGFPNTLVRALTPPITTAPGLLIPDNGTVTSTNPVALAGTIGSVQVNLNLTHSFRGDLELTLIHPDGTEVRLRDADATDNGLDLITGYPDPTPTVASLAVLNGKPVTGNWRLRVRDAFAADTGFLNAWSLQFGPQPALTDATGNYTFTNLFVGTYTVRPERAGFVFAPASIVTPVDRTNVNFAVLSGFVSGRITNNVGGMVGLNVRSAGGQNTTTGTNGNYLLAGLPAGNQTIIATNFGYSVNPVQRINVPLGTTNADFGVLAYPVAGRVTDPNSNGVAGITVAASSSATPAITDGDGYYLIPEVLSGDAFITALKPGFTFSPPSITLPVNAVVSNVNFIAISSPPTLTTVSDQVIALNGTTGPLRIDVNDAETRPAFLQLSATSSDPSLVPFGNIVFDGSGVQRTVAITPATNQFGVATISVTVTDESGLSASTMFTVRVNQLPVPGFGLALNLNGVNQSASAATGVIGDKGTFTVEAWTFAPSNSTPRTLVAQGNAFTIGVDATGKIRVGTNWNTGVSFPFGSWSHIAVVREAANTRLYLNGTLAASRGSAIPFPLASAPFQVGALGTSEYWLGQVDEVRVWRTSRTAAEIAGYRQVRLPGNELNLGGLWHFDERSEVVAANSVPSGSALTVSGATRVPAAIQFDPYVTLLGRNISDVLQAHDADKDPLTFALVSPPARGAVTLLNTNTGAFLYQANGTGEDQFTFSVNDGYATSAAHPVTIRILPDTNAPMISFLADQTINEDTLLGPIPFTVSDTERAATFLTVMGESSNPTLVASTNIVISGTGTNRTFTLLPSTNQFGSALITLVVSDGSQQAASSFGLTVLPVNDPPVLAPMTNHIVTRGQNFNQFIVATDVDTPAASLLYSASSSNPDLVSGYVDFCQQQNCVSLSSSGGQSGTAIITVGVTDGASTNFTAFQVTVNNPPTIAAIPDQSTYRNFPTAPIVITLADVDDPVASAVLTASSSNQAVVDDNGFTFSGPGANRTLVITPLGGRVGQTMITVTARDTFGSSSRTFQMVVEQIADYTITDLGAPGGGDSYAHDINDAGQISGTFRLPTFLNRAFRWQDGQMIELRSATAHQSFGHSINNLGDVGGSEQYSIGGVGEPVVFWGRGGSVNLDVPPGAFSSHVADLNDAGVAVVDAGFFGPFVWSGNGYLNNPLPTPKNPARINNAGEVVLGSGLLNENFAVLRLTEAGLVTVGTFGSFGGNPAHLPWSVNELGDVLAALAAGEINQQTVFYPFIYNFKTGRLQTNLVTSAGERPRALDQMKINDAGEAVFSGILTGTAPNAYLYSEGRLVNLNSLMPSNSPFVLLARANAINNVGDVVGEGITGSGKTHGFLMRRRWEVGQPLAPPLGAIDNLTGKVHRPPTLEALDGTPAAEFATAYLWSDYEQKLFFLRPVAAKISWATSSNLTDTNAAPVVTRLRTEWPVAPQLHIATAPVDLGPVDAASPYRPVALSFSTSTGASFDASTRTFNTSSPGYSVIRYLIAPEVPLGGSPNILTHSNYFEVVRTVVWNEAAFLRDNQPATVGVKVGDPRGLSVATNSFKSGWTVNAIAPYDGVGPDRAYDRATQTGPIIPVNRDTAAPNDDLVVAFYKKNTLTGALWPDLAARFAISWPTNAQTLVIANPEGSGPLPDSQYPDKRIYNQPNRALPGFNPNEEHAFLAPTSAGQGVFALRNDLNRADTSPNYVLLKYRNPTNSEWGFKLFQTTLLDATHDLVFTGEAGKEILPPYPLGLFPVCGGTTNWAGQAFRDHRGKFYASQGPTPENPYPQVRMYYFYPLQPDFYFDRNGDGVNDVSPGTCIRWEGIGQSSVFQTPQPVDVTYRILWPAETANLQIGETLLTAKNGLPGIKNWASAQIVYDSLNPDGLTPLASSVRLYDPLSARTLALTNVAGISASYQFPAEVALQTVGGKQVFADLPFHLRSRLSFDPVNKWLSFAGVLDDTVLGEPLLLVNVLSGKERDRLKQLSGEANFRRIVDALYDLTRNPNGVNATTPGVLPPSQELLIGFTTKYTAQVTNLVTTNITVQEFFGVRPAGSNLGFLATNIVQEPLGDLPKALTAGLPVASQPASFGRALQFDGSATAFANTLQPVAAPQTFTMSLWFRTTATQNGVLLGFGDSAQGPFNAADRTLSINSAGAISFYVWDGGPKTITSTNTFRDGQWHHAAATFSAATGMRLYVDGLLVAQNANVNVAFTYASGGYWRIGQNFNGTLDDVQIWNVVQTAQAIQQSRSRPVTGGEAGLIRYWRFDEISGRGVRDSTENRADAFLFGNFQRVPSTVPATGAADRFVVLAENNDPALGALPVTLHVIRLDGGPFGGDLKIIYPDNVFDERLTLRHSSDFGADPDRLEFEWWYHPDNADFNPTALPLVNADGSIANARGWLLYSPALAPNKFGQNTITIGDGGETSQFTLADNWFISRYRGYDVGGQTNWSNWIGDPASAEAKRAAFAPGWVKRVIEGINPFEDRTKDFHNNPAGTFASMLIQAGQRYEGNIALNPSGENLSSIGLIEAYTTVMNRAISLSIEGLPPVDSDPLNTALLLAASRISDLYMLLGNEAFADAQDPTIGFLSGSSELGTLATASFAFKNQLDSLLEEELTWCCCEAGTIRRRASARDPSIIGCSGISPAAKAKWLINAATTSATRTATASSMSLTAESSIRRATATLGVIILRPLKPITICSAIRATPGCPGRRMCSSPAWP
jgi:probable HAF family extracellular repeat protein